MKVRNTKILFVVSLILSFIVVFGALINIFKPSYQNSRYSTSLNNPTVVASCITSEQIAEITNATTEFQKQLVIGARERTEYDVTYIDKAYYSNGGKPPDNEGVCTDHFWRALEYTGIDFQEVLYQDMKASTADYPLHIWSTTRPDKFIDFRRVPNIEAYLEKYAQKLNTSIIPCDYESIKEWHPGDIVIFKIKGASRISDHIAIVSDKHDQSGLPYLFHNYGGGEVEQVGSSWYPMVAGHYRLVL